MIIIRAEQMKVFEQAARQQFEEKMMAHSKDFSPRLCEVLGEDQLRVAIRNAMKRAESHGFTNRGPVRLFIEMMFLFGSSFDTDPQYAAMCEPLGGSDDQMWRAQQMHQGSLDYLDNVAGQDAVNVHKALRDLLAFAREPVTFSDDFTGDLLREMKRIFPQKAVYVGEAGLRALIAEGFAEARRYEFSDKRQQGLIVVLKYAFGHGCMDDPLYPWIAQTMKDEKIVDPAGRAVRLEKKATTWLEHVVAGNEQGSLA